MHPAFPFEISQKLNLFATNWTDYAQLQEAIKIIKWQQVIKLHVELQALFAEIPPAQGEVQQAKFQQLLSFAFCETPFDVQTAHAIRDVQLSSCPSIDTQLTDYFVREDNYSFYGLFFKLRHLYFLGKVYHSDDPLIPCAGNTDRWLELQAQKNNASRYLIDLSCLNNAFWPAMKKAFSDVKLKDPLLVEHANACVSLTQSEIMQHIYACLNYYRQNQVFPELTDQLNYSLTEDQYQFIQTYTAVNLHHACGSYDFDSALTDLQLNPSAYLELAMPLRKTAAMIALEMQNPRFTEALLQANPQIAELSDDGGNHILHYAVMNLFAIADETVFRQWVQRYKALINMPNHKGETALFQAVSVGNIRFLVILLQEGADIVARQRLSLQDPLLFAFTKKSILEVNIILYYLMFEKNQEQMVLASLASQSPQLFTAESLASYPKSLQNYISNKTLSDAEKAILKLDLNQVMKEGGCTPEPVKTMTKRDDLYTLLLLRSLPNHNTFTLEQKQEALNKIKADMDLLEEQTDRMLQIFYQVTPTNFNASIFFEFYRFVKENQILDLSQIIAKKSKVMLKAIQMIEDGMLPIQYALHEDDPIALQAILRWPNCLEYHRATLLTSFKLATENGQVVSCCLLGEYLVPNQFLSQDEFQAEFLQSQENHFNKSRLSNRNDSVLEFDLKFNLRKQSELTMQKLMTDLQQSGELSALESHIVDLFENNIITLDACHATKDLKFIREAQALRPTEDLLDDEVIDQSTTPPVLRGNVFFAMSVGDIVVTNFLRDQYDVIQLKIREAINRKIVRPQDIWTSMHYSSFAHQRIYPTNTFLSPCGQYATYYRIAHKGNGATLTGTKYHEFDYVRLQPSFQHLGRTEVPVSHDMDLYQGDPTSFVAKKLVWFLRHIQSPLLPSHYGHHLASLFSDPVAFKREIQDFFNSIFTPYNFEIKISELIVFDAKDAADKTKNHYVRFVENPLAVMALSKWDHKPLLAKLKEGPKEAFVKAYHEEVVGLYNNSDFFMFALAECSATQIAWVLEMGVDMHNRSSLFIRQIADRYYNAYLNNSTDTQEAKAILNLLLLHGTPMQGLRGNKIRSLSNPVDTVQLTESLIELALLVEDNDLLTLLKTVFVRRDVAPFYWVDPSQPLLDGFNGEEHLQAIEQADEVQLFEILKNLPEVLTTLSNEGNLLPQKVYAIYHRLLLAALRLDSPGAMRKIFEHHRQLRQLGVRHVHQRCVLLKAILAKKVALICLSLSLEKAMISIDPETGESGILNLLVRQGLLNDPAIKQKLLQLRSLPDTNKTRIKDNFIYYVAEHDQQLAISLLSSLPAVTMQFFPSLRPALMAASVTRLHVHFRLLEAVYQLIPNEATKNYICEVAWTVLRQLEALEPFKLPWSQSNSMVLTLLRMYLKKSQPLKRLDDALVTFYSNNFSAFNSMLYCFPEKISTVKFVLKILSGQTLQSCEQFFQSQKKNDFIDKLGALVKYAAAYVSPPTDFKYPSLTPELMAWKYFLILHFIENKQAVVAGRLLTSIIRAKFEPDEDESIPSDWSAPFYFTELNLFCNANAANSELAAVYANVIISTQKLEQHFKGQFWEPGFLARCLERIFTTNPELLTDQICQKVNLLTLDQVQNSQLQAKLLQHSNKSTMYSRMIDLTSLWTDVSSPTLDCLKTFFKKRQYNTHWMTTFQGVQPCAWIILERTHDNYVLETDSLYPMFYEAHKEDSDVASKTFQMGSISISLLTRGRAVGRQAAMNRNLQEPSFFPVKSLHIAPLPETRVKVGVTGLKNKHLKPAATTELLTLCTLLSQNPPDIAAQIQNLQLPQLTMPAMMDRPVTQVFATLIRGEQEAFIAAYQSLSENYDMRRLSVNMIVDFPYRYQSLEARINAKQPNADKEIVKEQWTRIRQFIKVFYASKPRSLLTCAVLVNNEAALDFLIKQKHRVADNFEMECDAFLLALVFNRVSLARKLFTTISTVNEAVVAGYLQAVLYKFIEPDVYSGFPTLKSASLLGAFCQLFREMLPCAPNQQQQFSSVDHAMQIMCRVLVGQGSKAEFLTALKSIQQFCLYRFAHKEKRAPVDFHAYLYPHYFTNCHYSPYTISPTFQEAAMQSYVDLDAGRGLVTQKPTLQLSETAVDWSRPSDPEFTRRVLSLQNPPVSAPVVNPGVKKRSAASQTEVQLGKRESNDDDNDDPVIISSTNTAATNSTSTNAPVAKKPRPTVDLTQDNSNTQTSAVSSTTAVQVEPPIQPVVKKPRTASTGAVSAGFFLSAQPLPAYLVPPPPPPPVPVQPFSLQNNVVPRMFVQSQVPTQPTQLSAAGFFAQPLLQQQAAVAALQQGTINPQLLMPMPQQSMLRGNYFPLPPPPPK